MRIYIQASLNVYEKKKISENNYFKVIFLIHMYMSMFATIVKNKSVYVYICECKALYRYKCAV